MVQVACFFGERCGISLKFPSCLHVTCVIIFNRYDVETIETSTKWFKGGETALGMDCVSAHFSWSECNLLVDRVANRVKDEVGHVATLILFERTHMKREQLV